MSWYSYSYGVRFCSATGVCQTFSWFGWVLRSLRLPFRLGAVGETTYRVLTNSPLLSTCVCQVAWRSSSAWISWREWRWGMSWEPKLLKELWLSLFTIRRFLGTLCETLLERLVFSLVLCLVVESESTSVISISRFIGVGSGSGFSVGSRLSRWYGFERTSMYGYLCSVCWMRKSSNVLWSWGKLGLSSASSPQQSSITS